MATETKVKALPEADDESSQLNWATRLIGKQPEFVRSAAGYEEEETDGSQDLLPPGSPCPDPGDRGWLGETVAEAIPQPCAHESVEECSCGRPEIHELVADDLAHRHSLGIEEYGVSLRDCEIDTFEYAYEEVLDLAMYLRKVILERDRVIGPLRSGASLVANGEAK